MLSTKTQPSNQILQDFRDLIRSPAKIKGIVVVKV